MRRLLLAVSVATIGSINASLAESIISVSTVVSYSKVIRTNTVFHIARAKPRRPAALWATSI